MAPVIEVSLMTAPVSVSAVPLMDALVPLAEPVLPRKPVPAMVTVTGLRFVPLLGVTLLMDGAGVVTVYLSAETVTLVPPSAVTVISYVPIGVPAGITTPSILLSFIAVIGVRE